jgi:hypothetical protein
LTPNVSQLLNSGLGGTENLKSGTTVNGRKVEFGKRTNLYFPSYTTTKFTMAITLSYTPDAKTGLFGDITCSEFFQACGLANTPRRSMRVDYSAEVTIGSLSNLGFKPVFVDKVNINCPFSKDALQKIYSQLGLT